MALKVPRQRALNTTKALDRFLGEAKALARLRHPRIVPVYEAGCAGERYYIAMALIEGCSLAERLTERPLAIHKAAELVAELAEALAYAHTQGVVHRDVKPANVRLDDHGAVYLMDFGIAYRPDSGEIPLAPGMILGTPAYLAPEQAQGGQTVLPASDQYSLGVVFYELLCGRTPVLWASVIRAVPYDPSCTTLAAHRSRLRFHALWLPSVSRPWQRAQIGDTATANSMADDLRCWLRGETPRPIAVPGHN